MRFSEEVEDDHERIEDEVDSMEGSLVSKD